MFLCSKSFNAFWERSIIVRFVNGLKTNGSIIWVVFLDRSIAVMLEMLLNELFLISLIEIEGEVNLGSTSLSFKSNELFSGAIFSFRET